MREIKFRGKRLSDDTWVYGYYIKHLDYTPGCFEEASSEKYKHYIMMDGFSDWSMPRGTVHYEVDPKTMGQYTGIRDKADVDIYEDDIVRTPLKKYIQDSENDEYVIYVNGSFRTKSISSNDKDYPLGAYGKLSKGYVDLEVTGNIHDNPELKENIND